MANGLLPQTPQRTGLLSAIFAGQNDPNLSPEENRRARSQALIQAGLQTIIGSAPQSTGTGRLRTPSALEAVAGGALAGQEAGGGFREQAVAQQAAEQQRLQLLNRQRQFQNVLRDPEIRKAVGAQRIAAIQLLPFEEGLEALQEALVPAKPVTVAPGTSVFDPDSGASVFTNPANLPGDIVSASTVLGIDLSQPMTPEQRSALSKKVIEFKRSGASTITVDTGQKAIESLMARRIETDLGKRDEARLRSAQLQTFEDILARTPDITGGTQELFLRGRQILSGMGVINLEKLGDQEVLTSLANQIALTLPKPAGPISERELKFIQQQGPSLLKSQRGNVLIIKTLQRLADREVEIGQLLDEFIASGEPLSQWESKKAQFLRENPMESIGDIVDEAMAEGLIPSDAEFTNRGGVVRGETPGITTPSSAIPGDRFDPLRGGR